MRLKDRIEGDFKEAIRSREMKKVSCLRLIKAAIHNKEIEFRKELSDDQVEAVLGSLARQRKESIEQFKKGNREDLVAQETAELAWIESYLPQGLSEEELKKIIQETIHEVGAQSPQDLGKVMKTLMPKVRGKADGKMVNAWVNKMLETK